MCKYRNDNIFMTVFLTFQGWQKSKISNETELQTKVRKWIVFCWLSSIDLSKHQINLFSLFGVSKSSHITLSY